MLQTRQYRATGFAQLEHIVFDVHDAGHRFPGMAKELQANGACMRRHAMQNPPCTGDQAITTLFLDARQATQKFIGDVFAQAGFAKTCPGNI